MIAVSILAAMFLGTSAADPVRIEITWDGTTCGARIDGVSISQEELDRRARQWGAGKRRILILGNSDTPYRCIGGTIYNLQAAGLTRFEFVSAPPPAQVDLFVPAGRCRVRLNRKWVTFETLRQQSAGWKFEQPEIHFRPSPRASFQCVDRVLGFLRDANVTKLGFIGNMRAEPEDKEPKP